jgi:hypothetical protein
MLVLVTNIGQQCWTGEDGGRIGQAAYADDGPEVAIWGRSETHLISLLLAVAINAANMWGSNNLSCQILGVDICLVR